MSAKKTKKTDKSQKNFRPGTEERDLLMGDAGTHRGLPRLPDRKMGAFRIHGSWGIEGNGSDSVLHRGKDRS